MAEIVRDRIAFAAFEGDYHIRATYMRVPANQALIEITRGDVEVRSFLFPSYKIWNVAAHAADIVAELEHGGEDGSD